jgi:hypothetical protein
MSSKGIWRSNYAPPFYRFLWRYNVPIRPPHFSSFPFNFVWMGGCMGIVWGAIMWALIWRGRDISGIEGIAQTVVFGIFFGGVMASYFAYSARKHKLPAWSELRPEAEAFE